MCWRGPRWAWPVFLCLRGHCASPARYIAQRRGSWLPLGAAGLALLSWPGGQPPDYVPMLAAWLATTTVCLHWDRRHLQFAAPSGPARIIVSALLGALLFWGEQKLLKTLGLQLQWGPSLWSATKGAVSGAFVALFVPWVLRTVRLTPVRSTPAHP